MNHTPAAQAHFGGVSFAERADALTLYVTMGSELVLYRVDRQSLMLTEVNRVTLPAPVQYIVPHPSLGLLYVATSNRSISKADDVHTLSSVSVDPDTGALRVLGNTALPSRPIHLTATNGGEGVLITYNLPAEVTYNPIDAEGIAQVATSSVPSSRLGAYPHQVRMLPSGEAAVVVVRGNHAHHSADKLTEEPGSLDFYHWRSSLTRIGTLAPAGGFGFGTRHLDFHPSGRWAALSMERENDLRVFPIEGDVLGAHEACRVSTLPADTPAQLKADPDQLCSAIHFNARGDRLYVANRHDPSVYRAHDLPCEASGNNIAVFAFDAATGQATLMQHVQTDSVHVRTFSLDRSDRLLVAASILPALVRRDDRTERIPARLSFFRVADDGTLQLTRVQDMPVQRPLNMFWSHLDGAL